MIQLNSELVLTRLPTENPNVIYHHVMDQITDKLISSVHDYNIPSIRQFTEHRVILPEANPDLLPVELVAYKATLQALIYEQIITNPNLYPEMISKDREIPAQSARSKCHLLELLETSRDAKLFLRTAQEIAKLVSPIKDSHRLDRFYDLTLARIMNSLYS